jgi:hypothetical protein
MAVPLWSLQFLLIEVHFVLARVCFMIAVMHIKIWALPIMMAECSLKMHEQFELGLQLFLSLRYNISGSSIRFEIQTQNLRSQHIIWIKITLVDTSNHYFIGNCRLSMPIIWIFNHNLSFYYKKWICDIQYELAIHNISLQYTIWVYGTQIPEVAFYLILIVYGIVNAETANDISCSDSNIIYFNFIVI